MAITKYNWRSMNTVHNAVSSQRSQRLEVDSRSSHLHVRQKQSSSSCYAAEFSLNSSSTDIIITSASLTGWKVKATASVYIEEEHRKTPSCPNLQATWKVNCDCPICPEPHKGSPQLSADLLTGSVDGKGRKGMGGSGGKSQCRKADGQEFHYFLLGHITMQSI